MGVLVNHRMSMSQRFSDSWEEKYKYKLQLMSCISSWNNKNTKQYTRC